MPRFIEAYNARFAKAPQNPHDAHRPLRADENLDLIFAWRELRKVTQSLTLHYERKLYLLADTPENRRLIGKYIEVFQFPDGRLEIRVAGQSLPYSLYDKLGEIDQGAIVENKRLGQVLRVAQATQAVRDHRSVDVPSTAHRADGTPIPRSRVVGSKRQRELGPTDLQRAIEAVQPERLPPLGRQTPLRGKTIKRRTQPKEADISTEPGSGHLNLAKAAPEWLS